MDRCGRGRPTHWALTSWRRLVPGGGGGACRSWPQCAAARARGWGRPAGFEVTLHFAAGAWWWLAVGRSRSRLKASGRRPLHLRAPGVVGDCMSACEGSEGAKQKKNRI
jgi:hypothetical protein